MAINLFKYFLLLLVKTFVLILIFLKFDDRYLELFVLPKIEILLLNFKNYAQRKISLRNDQLEKYKSKPHSGYRLPQSEYSEKQSPGTPRE